MDSVLRFEQLAGESQFKAVSHVCAAAVGLYLRCTCGFCDVAHEVICARLQ